jgi:MFS family permease
LHVRWGFFARPFGSIVLGRVGDRIGRRALLTLSIGLMGGATLVLGLLPTYNQVGILAPILLMLMRVLQGISLGGEFTGSMVYTTEASSPLLRGLVSSSTAAGTTIGFILGSATAYLINHSLTTGQVDAWGWRVPFIGSIVFMVGYLLRRGIHETEEGDAGPSAAALPCRQTSTPTFGTAAMNAGTDVHVCGRAAAAAPAAGRWRRRLPGHHARAVRGAVREAAGAGCRTPAATPDGGRLREACPPAHKLMAARSHFFWGQLLMAVPLGMALGLQGDGGRDLSARTASRP